MRAGVAAATAVATGSLYRLFNPVKHVDTSNAVPVELLAATESESELLAKGWRVAEDKTSEESILTCNNFYEFTTNKEAVMSAAAGFTTDGWQLVVDGMVDKPRTFTIDDLHALSPPQERVWTSTCEQPKLEADRDR